MATARKKGTGRTRTARKMDDPQKMFSRTKIVRALEEIGADGPKFFLALSNLPDQRGARTPPEDVTNAGDKAKGDFAKFMELLGEENFAVAGRKFGLYSKWKEAQGD